ncbi:MAG TPA: recombinase RecT [Bacillus sp. (in: firmicutes)]|nr:recombinase RecT [Bacillus sp. (in: firmicutes)]
MKKLIEFTQEQKTLIWSTKVKPNNGTHEEALLFVEVCEMNGLNPLTNDIIFQKFESKQGWRVNFITTRDGYLKAAQRDPNFVKVMSAVVKEGDEFQFDTVTGGVNHKFGSKRGKILGAWAIAEHAKRGKLPAFVDFDEYFTANAQSKKGRSPIWDNLPSAMIQKVAEVFVLRRQFPLGGIVTEEEMGMEDEFQSVTGNSTCVQPEETDIPQAEIKQENVINMKAKQEEKKETKKATEPIVQKQKAQPTEPSVKEEKQAPQKEAQAAPVAIAPQQEPKAPAAVETKVEEQPVIVQQPVVEEKPVVEESLVKTEEVATKEEPKPSTTPTEPAQEQEPAANKGQFTLVKIETGKAPSGIAYAKLVVKDNATGAEKLVLAQGAEKVEMLDMYEEGHSVDIDIKSDGAFNFLESIKMGA